MLNALELSGVDVVKAFLSLMIFDNDQSHHELGADRIPQTSQT